jgi:hypothetical protein
MPDGNPWRVTARSDEEYRVPLWCGRVPAAQVGRGTPQRMPIPKRGDVLQDSRRGVQAMGRARSSRGRGARERQLVRPLITVVGVPVVMFPRGLAAVIVVCGHGGVIHRDVREDQARSRVPRHRGNDQNGRGECTQEGEHGRRPCHADECAVNHFAPGSS